MAERIVIDPVTRIEGHAKITIRLDERGEVADARLHVTELRGFESFCVGRSFREMPVLTARICGICPVSHLLAAARAGDALLAVQVPEPARLLRELLNLAQLVQSHALSFFHLSGPDLLLGFDAPPARRNLAGLAEALPELARDGVRLRKFGQEVIEAVAGRRIHPSFAVPGGVARPLAAEGRDRILAGIPEALAVARRALRAWKAREREHPDEIRSFGDLPTLFLGTVAEDGTLAYTGGRLRFVDETGALVADGIDPADWRTWIAEAVDPASYLKAPYFRPRGAAGGTYRVGPLARLNVASRLGTPLADAEHAEFRALGRGAVLSTFHAHRARLVEVIHALERMPVLLEDPLVLSPDVLAGAACNRRRGVGSVEAPRGTLFHDYEVDRDGVLVKVDLVVATGQNALAMNAAVAQIARRFVSGGRFTEGALNRIEGGVRAFDPCLSCATHAAGRLPLRVELRGPGGALLDVAERTA
jgi:NAD-reducing hydrogenase large subunit